jgi:hypothetical protein
LQFAHLLFLPLPCDTTDTWGEITACSSENMHRHDIDMMKFDVT